MKKTKMSVDEIVELSKTKIKEADLASKELKTISITDLLSLIYESLVPMSKIRRNLFYELAGKIPAREISKNLEEILRILIKNPTSLRFVSQITDRIKKISFEDCVLCLKN
jgi:hypothetical protein